jgi:hypothetical protein
VGKNHVHRFRTLFKDLPLKYQNVTVKIPKFLPFTDFQNRPSRPYDKNRTCGPAIPVRCALRPVAIAVALPARAERALI